MNELHRDPPRWLESGFLSEELASELAAYGAQAPSEAATERMAEQLALGLAEAAAPLAAEPVAAVKLKLVFVASVILAGAVGLLQVARPAPTVMRVPEAAEMAPTRMAPLAETSLAVELAPPVEEVPVVEAPVRARRGGASRGVASASVRLVTTEPAPPQVQPPARTGSADVLTELTMLARARRALLNDPARALELAEEHARTYPRGTFDEEREVLAIESLVKLGRKPEARVREKQFEARFPRSAQIAHLAKMIAMLGD